MATTKKRAITQKEREENRRALRKRLAPYKKRPKSKPDIWKGHDKPIGLTELGLELTEVPNDQLEVEMASLQPYMPSQEEIERVCESIRDDWPQWRLSKGGDV